MNGCPRVGCWFGDGLELRSKPNPFNSKLSGGLDIFKIGIGLPGSPVPCWLPARLVTSYPIRRLVRLVGYPRLAASNQTRSKLFKRSRAIRRVSGMFLRMIRRNQIPLLNWRSIQKGEKNAYWCSKSKLSSSW